MYDVANKYNAISFQLDFQVSATAFKKNSLICSAVVLVKIGRQLHF